MTDSLFEVLEQIKSQGTVLISQSDILVTIKVQDGSSTNVESKKRSELLVSYDQLKSLDSDINQNRQLSTNPDLQEFQQII